MEHEQQGKIIHIHHHYYHHHHHHYNVNNSSMNNVQIGQGNHLHVHDSEYDQNHIAAKNLCEDAVVENIIMQDSASQTDTVVDNVDVETQTYPLQNLICDNVTEELCQDSVVEDFGELRPVLSACKLKKVRRFC